MKNTNAETDINIDLISLFELGCQQFDLENYETAVKLFEQDLSINTDEFYALDSYGMLGTCNMFLAKKFENNKIHYYKKAIEYYKKIVDCYPNDISIRILNNLALAYLNSNDYDYAIITYEKLIKMDNQDINALMTLASLYNVSKNSELALGYALKAIEIDDKKESYYFSLALIYKNLAKHEESITALKKAITLNPDYFEAYNNIADAYNCLGHYTQALEYVTEALNINPADITSMRTLAESYEKLGAKQILEKSFNGNQIYKIQLELNKC